MSSGKKAVVLLSGGLDSTTALAVAKKDGFTCYALTISYGQRHHAELRAAQRIATQMGVAEHYMMPLDLRSIGGSALTSNRIDVPTGRSEKEMGGAIPVTYVPARNTIFLSLALAYAEVIGAYDIYVGVNCQDYSGYPDCRPAFINAFEELAKVATKVGVEGGTFRIHAPLIMMSKVDIINLGVSLGVDYGLTHSCYNPSEEGLACGVCDSCILRRNGFEMAKLSDPTRYVA